MSISQNLLTFQTSVQQCDSLIASVHRTDTNGVSLFSQLDREQITEAAFLNMFIAWEEYLEASINDFMMGDPTLGGTQPARFVSPSSKDHSAQLVVHVQKYFDYANHEYVRKIAKLYFLGGYPFEVPLSSIISDLADLKTIRNACAHFSSTTRLPLQGLALRIFGQPTVNISVYDLLTATDPRLSPNTTVYAGYRDKLLAAADRIANG